MAELTPTRSAVIELSDERRAMHEGYTFLDEKCLLLAAEIVAELRRYATAQRAFAQAWANAVEALEAAVARHGLQGVQVYAPLSLSGARFAVDARPLLGLTLQSAAFVALPSTGAPTVEPSPEGEACRRAFVVVVDKAAPLAASLGNLSRLDAEYRRSIRRARALQDVLLPELDATIGELETRLEELEQEDAIAMRQGALAG